jgi:hypothetical protein
LKEKDVVSKSESFKTKNGSRYRRMKREKTDTQNEDKNSLSLSLSRCIPPKIFCMFTAYTHAPLAANKAASEVRIGPV